VLAVHRRRFELLDPPERMVRRGAARELLARPRQLPLARGAAAAALYAALVLRRLAVRARPAPPET
ncbi:MAG: hypothetical protein AAFZ09_13655, partial [Pseudomonadota bacterium]